jgi:hypothetical protein
MTALDILVLCCNATKNYSSSRLFLTRIPYLDNFAFTKHTHPRCYIKHANGTLMIYSLQD